ncbi:MAG: hypothetical protein WCT01_04850 [Candidatus Shapirobacteria bacterium]|jgi:hypothetical protein
MNYNEPQLLARGIVRDYRDRKQDTEGEYSYRGGRKISYYSDSGLEIDDMSEE